MRGIVLYVAAIASICASAQAQSPTIIAQEWKHHMPFVLDDGTTVKLVTDQRKMSEGDEKRLSLKGVAGNILIRQLSAQKIDGDKVRDLGVIDEIGIEFTDPIAMSPPSLVCDVKPFGDMLFVISTLRGTTKLSSVSAMNWGGQPRCNVIATLALQSVASTNAPDYDDDDVLRVGPLSAAQILKIDRDIVVIELTLGNGKTKMIRRIPLDKKMQ